MKYILLILCITQTLIGQVSNTCFNSVSDNSKLVLPKNGNERIFLLADDFDGDLFKDLICFSDDMAYGLTIFHGAANNMYGVHQSISFSGGINGSLIAATAGDFNNNGTKDFAIAVQDGTNQVVKVFLNNGVGVFSNSFNVICNHPASAMVSSDFNNDGKLDLAFVGTIPSSSNLLNVSILRGVGNGSFTASQTLTVGSAYDPFLDIKAADFNNDSKQDLVVTNPHIGSLSIILNSSINIFSVTTTYSITSSFVEVDDFNTDGKADLLVCNGIAPYSVLSSLHNTELGIMYGTGLGTFSPITNFTTTTNNKGYLVKAITGDFNNDSKVDIVGVYDSGDGYWDLAYGNASYFNLYTGTGTGAFSFRSHQEDIKGYLPVCIVKSDLNSDNKLDLSILGYEGANLQMPIINILGLGNGDFVSDKEINMAPYTPLYSASDDFNNDGANDIVTVTDSASSKNKMSVLINTGNGTFNQSANYLASNGDFLINDFNGDGVKDVVQYVNGYNTNFYFGTPTGLLSIPQNKLINAYGQGFFVASSDFNEDGFGDVLIQDKIDNYNSNICYKIAFGSASGNLSTVSYSTTIANAGLVADVNADGHADIIDYKSPISISVYLGTGVGTFSSPINTPSLSVGAIYNMKSVDFNNDGFSDVCFYSNTIQSQYSILFGSSSGLLSSIITYTLPLRSTAFEINDFNTDGIKDIAFILSNSTWGNNDKHIKIMLGTGTGSFIADMPSYSINSPSQASNEVLHGKDFNGDGKVDILSTTNGIMSVFFNGISDINITSITNVICVGENLILSANGSSPNYTWSTGATTNTVSVSPPSNSSFVVSGNSLFSGCNNSAGIVISVNQSTPTLVLSSNTNSMCVGATVQITSTGANTYTWSTGAVSNSIVASPNLTTTYSVIGTNSVNCSSTQTISISVNPTPTISINSGSICSGSNYTLIPSGGVTYTYSSGSATVAPNISSTYTVYGSDALGCYSSAISSITVSPSPTISVNSGSICIGDSFTITPSGAISYTYSSINPIITPSITNTYTITGEDAVGCIGSVVNSITVNSLPNLSISSTNSVCINSSATINASGASTYTWNTGIASTSITISPIVNTTYTVTGTDANNCSNSQTVIITVDNTCQDVWPGDANSDGVADNLDVLELGLHYAQTGTPRATISNLWQSYYAANWSGTITNGKNLNHSNCNGDGIINDDDTLAIYINYNSMHAFKPAQATTNPQLTIVPDQNIVNKGTWGTSSIYLGDASTIINNINGVAFTVNYDKTVLETDSVWIEYPMSFINAGNQNLKFRKRDFTNGKLYTATTHTINGNVNGYGKIAILHYKIKSSLTADNVMNLSISQANQSDAYGTITPLTAGSATLMALGTSIATNLNALTNGNYISLHPNPTNGVLTINSTTELQKIEVMAITGQLLISEVPLSTNHVLHLDHLANGVYFVNLYQNNRIVKREKIILYK